MLENRDRLENCYYNDLYLEFRPAGRTGGEEEDGYTVCITLQSGARHTLAVLQACGLDGTLVTQAQIQKEDAVYAQSTTGRGWRQGRAGSDQNPNARFCFFKKPALTNLPVVDFLKRRGIIKAEGYFSVWGENEITIWRFTAMKEVYVVNCCRTAVGSFGGSLKDTPATELGAVVVKER